MLQSMTAFASYSSYHHAAELAWEIKSTNHRYLEFYFKIPEEFRAIEYELREIAKKEFTRGKLDCFLTLTNHTAKHELLKINQLALEQLVAAKGQLTAALQAPLALDFMMILTYPGLLEVTTTSHDDLLLLTKQNFIQALNSLKHSRCNEGAQICTIIKSKVAAMHEQISIIADNYPLSINEHMANLRRKLAEIPDERGELAARIDQELIFYLQKTDINEEIDRLKMHLDEVANNCNATKAVGRRLDFLMQELNREANTLAAKAISKVVSRATIELKVLIEQMREQVQNLE